MRSWLVVEWGNGRVFLFLALLDAGIDETQVKLDPRTNDLNALGAILI